MRQRALRIGLCVLAASAMGLPGQTDGGAGKVERTGDPGSMVSSAVTVGDTVYLSGTMAPPDVPGDKAKGTLPLYRSDTKTQAIGALKQIEATLSGLGLGLGDVVQLSAFLTADPAKGGVMDLEGWNAAYREFFGTAEQPNKPARATLQVAGLVYPTGRIEIMVIAVRSHAKPR